MRYATEITKTPRGTICCGNDPKVVYFNPYNEVVQCHSCGHVYEPKPSVAETESDELDPTVNTRRRGDASLLQRLIDELEHAVAQGYQPNLLDIAEARQALSAAAPSVLDAIRIVENCEYENVAVDVILRCLKALSSCVSVSDSARRAAEEIRDWLGLTGRVDGEAVNEVAAIISKHFPAAQPAAIAGRVVNISTHGEPTRARLREVETSVSNGYERECRELGWSKSLQSALRDLHFLLTFFQDDTANAAAPAESKGESNA